MRLAQKTFSLVAIIVLRDQRKIEKKQEKSDSIRMESCCFWLFDRVEVNGHHIEHLTLVDRQSP